MRLFEYPHTLLHQKIMTVDGVWCAIGSSNFDDRSFETNDEISMASATPRWPSGWTASGRSTRRATEIKLEKWVKRPVWEKLQDNAVYLINELL